MAAIALDRPVLWVTTGDFAGKKKPHPRVRFFEQSPDQAAMLPLSLFIAFFSS